MQSLIYDGDTRDGKTTTQSSGSHIITANILSEVDGAHLEAQIQAFTSTRVVVCRE